MRAFLDHPKLSGEGLVGDSFMKGDVLPVHADEGFDLQTSCVIFGGFSAAPRLAVGYRAETRLFSRRDPPVRAPTADSTPA